MLNTLKMSLKIDDVYSLNAFIYNLRKLPVLKDLITTDIYKSKSLKNVIHFFAIIYRILKAIFLRLLYFLTIFFCACLLNENNFSKTFIHIYFIFTIIGFFINNKLLVTSRKKYFSIIIFQMNAKKFMESLLCSAFFKNLFLNSLSFLIFNTFLHISLSSIIILILLPIILRITGEALNILFYKKYSYVWLNNYFLYFTILIFLLLLCLLPIKNIFVTSKILNVSLLIAIIFFPISLIYLLKIKDYKLLYKKLNTKNLAMNQENASAYSRQQMVEVKNKDINISSKKIKNKKGYDLFNTIFFERHKEILLRSAKKYAVLLAVIYVVIGVLIYNNPAFFSATKKFLTNNLGYFVIIMYFINRGAIVTQAMFFNCDHAMLRYNFYREPQVLLNLFKKRLITLIKVNLLPAFVIVLGNSSLLYFTKQVNISMYIMLALYIISLSIFFSIHYLVIYYLLQPFNSEMQLKKVSYSLVSILTYVVCYFATNITLNYFNFSLLGILFTITYSLISLYLVYKFSPRTFKIN